jgi:hypothetical protein
MSSSVVYMKKASPAVRAKMETMLLTTRDFEQWSPAPFQRPLRVNAKVLSVAEDIKQNGGIIPGILTLGTLGDDPQIHVIDGQHRVEAARLSELKEFIADVRICGFDTVADMAMEYVELNSRITSMRPDDFLKGMELSVPILKKVRDTCDFVGYENAKRNNRSCVISMSVALRCWYAAHMETPSHQATSAVTIARSTDMNSAEKLCQFLSIARNAWGNDQEYARLWASLNLTLCAWLWLQYDGNPTSRLRKYTRLDAKQFSKILMSLSADASYIDWLGGRRLSERDRGPCYSRIKHIGWARLKADGLDIKLPAPTWATGK